MSFIVDGPSFCLWFVAGRSGECHLGVSEGYCVPLVFYLFPMIAWYFLVCFKYFFYGFCYACGYVSWVVKEAVKRGFFY